MTLSAIAGSLARGPGPRRWWRRTWPTSSGHPRRTPSSSSRSPAAAGAASDAPSHAVDGGAAGRRAHGGHDDPAAALAMVAAYEVQAADIAALQVRRAAPPLRLRRGGHPILGRAPHPGGRSTPAGRSRPWPSWAPIPTWSRRPPSSRRTRGGCSSASARSWRPSARRAETRSAQRSRTWRRPRRRRRRAPGSRRSARSSGRPATAGPRLPPRAQRERGLDGLVEARRRRPPPPGRRRPRGRRRPMRGPLSGMVTTSVGAVRAPRRSAERRVVEPAVVPADEQRHRVGLEGLERGLRRQHVGREAVVDELDRSDVAERVAAAGQALEPLGRLGQRASSSDLRDAEGPQHGAGDRRVARVVRSRAGRAPPTRRRRRATSVRVHPLHVGPEERRPARGAGRRSRRPRPARTPGLVHSDSLSA